MSRPKNFSDALEQLENHETVREVRGKIKDEIRRLEETLEKLKPQIDDVKQKVTSEFKGAKDSVESEVRKNPWAAIGIAGLIFFVLGFLFGFKGRGRD